MCDEGGVHKRKKKMPITMPAMGPGSGSQQSPELAAQHWSPLQQSVFFRKKPQLPSYLFENMHDAHSAPATMGIIMASVATSKTTLVHIFIFACFPISLFYRIARATSDTSVSLL
jgi:hypothetical protein